MTSVNTYERFIESPYKYIPWLTAKSWLQKHKFKALPIEIDKLSR